MIIGELLRDISEAGLKLAASEGYGALRVSPAKNLTPQLVSAIKEYEEALMRVAPEGQRFRETGVIQSERRVFEMARARMGFLSTYLLPRIGYKPVTADQKVVTATPKCNPGHKERRC